MSGEGAASDSVQGRCMRWVRVGVGVSVGAALCVLAVLMSSAQTLCSYSTASFVEGAYVREQQVWLLPVARCTTGVVGGTADSTIVVGWGAVITVLLGVALAVVSVVAFRRDSSDARLA
ncbi:hypothetical protein [Prescottella subtropica]|uniref:hypothetical protein n=1 Tax=Prescottella subtropica TaxID=2545757 RepID=UPI0010F5DD0D|nr:hypothetical protein [Prescottella subtropica]